MQKILCLPFFVRAAYMLQSISVEQSPDEYISDWQLQKLYVKRQLGRKNMATVAPKTLLKHLKRDGCNV